MFNVPPNSYELIARTGLSLQGLEKALNNDHFEREWLIHQIMLALLTGQNVLVYGSHGADKTRLAEHVLSSLRGPVLDGSDLKIFTIQIDNETTQDDILGPIDIPLYTNKGIKQRKMDGYLPHAHVAVFDEIFDGPAVLRQLNDAFNERALFLGTRRLDLPLHMPIATTNRSPESVAAMLPHYNLRAFSDRFLFVAKVGYLDNQDNVSRMMRNFVTNTRSSSMGTVAFRDLQEIAQYIRTTCQYPDEDFLEVLQELIESYSAQLSPEDRVTDRRKNWLTQLPEAQAIFYGRLELDLEDLLAVRFGLCPNGDSEAAQLFDQVAKKVLMKAAASFQNTRNIDAAVRSLFDRVTADLSRIDTIANTPGWPSGPSDVGRALSEVNSLIKELETAQPQKETNAKRQKQLHRHAEELQAKISSKA